MDRRDLLVGSDQTLAAKSLPQTTSDSAIHRTTIAQPSAAEFRLAAMIRPPDRGLSDDEVACLAWRVFGDEFVDLDVDVGRRRKARFRPGRAVHPLEQLLQV